VILEQLKARHHWSAITRAPVRGDHFFMQWPIPEVRSLTVRLTLRAGGRELARTAPSTVYPQKTFVKDCTAPTPPVGVPAGDGWVTGGLYEDGGPPPGINACVDAAFTATATDTAGIVIATAQVAAKASYTLVLPAGKYTLSASDGCLGEATVTAGRETQADIVCQIP
jgi:hypothetical protein